MEKQRGITIINVNKQKTTNNATTEKSIKDIVSGSYRHGKCAAYQCNHPLDPPEWDCISEMRQYND